MNLFSQWTTIISESKHDGEAVLKKLLPRGGEGGDTGEIIPGQSIVFATLEVCLGVLSRRVPTLNPAAQSTGFQYVTRSGQVTEEVCEMLSTVVQVLTDLPSLCSIAGMYLVNKLQKYKARPIAVYSLLIDVMVV